VRGSEDGQSRGGGGQGQTASSAARQGRPIPPERSFFLLQTDVLHRGGDHQNEGAAVASGAKRTCSDGVNAVVTQSQESSRERTERMSSGHTHFA
jgi:hypothetical protein